MKIKKGFSYDDVLLVPKLSYIQHRADLSTKVDLGKGIILDIPIISANMKFCSGIQMVQEIAQLGGLGILHRFNDHRDDDFIKSVNLCKTNNKVWPGRLTYSLNNHIGVSVGTNDLEKIYFDEKYIPLKDWLKVICVDVAHGHHTNTYNMIKHIKEKMPEALLIAGNVATGSGAVYLADAGADVIKAGVGPGSTCSTRIETGNGYPQLSCLENVRDALDGAGFKNTKVIADGGIKAAGDIVKALVFADAVMIGNLLAGTDQAPGDIIINNGLKYKQYAGSSTHKTNNVEGVSGFVPYRGDVKNVIQKLMDGLRSGMSYQGVSNLEDLKINPEFVEISNAGIIESKPHDIIF